MRKMITLLAAGAAAFAPFAAGIPAASASVTPGYYGTMCDDGSALLCLNDNNGSSQGGTPILMENRRAGADAQTIQVNRDYACPGGDQVMYNPPPLLGGCPFGVLQWDYNYAGDTIVTLKLPKIGDNSCIGVASGLQTLALEACNSISAMWVLHYDSHGCSNLINVANSGSDYSVAMTGSDTTLYNATIQKYTDGALQVWNGC